ncbi:MAG: HAMP domain-containing sensor histidine kinase [Clostridium sp.]
MMELGNLDKYIYMNVDKYRFIIYFFITVGVASFYLDEDLLDNMEVFMVMGTIVISVCALIFINYCMKYKEKQLFIIVQYFLLVVSGILFVQALNLYEISIFGSFFSNETFEFLDSEYFIALFYLFIVMLFAINRKNSKYLVMSSGIFIAVILLIKVLYSFDILSANRTVATLFLLKIIMSLVTLVLIKDLPLVNGKYINILAMISIVDIVASIIESNIYHLNTFNGYSNLFLITGLIRLLVLVLFVINGCEKLITSTYKGIFDDTIKVNKKLGEINLKLKQQTHELENTRQALSDEELLYKSFLRVLPVPLVIISTENKRINYCNRSFINLVDRDVRDIINNVIDNIITIQYDDISDLRLGINKIYRGEYSKFNDCRSLDIMPLSIKDSENSVILMIEDVTEKMKVYNIKNEILEKEIKERIKKDFLSNISHDLKTPINVISSAAQVNNLYAESMDRDIISEYINVSKENLDTLIQLTDNLMNIETGAQMHLSPVIVEADVVSFLDKKVSSLIKYADTKGITLYFYSDEDEIYLKFDKEFLERIILNLISNAMKFTSYGGKIIIYVREEDEKILIEVMDNGRGIRQEFINSAFEKYAMQYELADKSKDGSGIGLFVVYNLMKLQGGNVEVTSSEGEGAKFTLVFKRG